MSVNGLSNSANPAYTNFPAPESAGQNAPNKPSGGAKFPVPPRVEVKTVKGEDPRELHRRNLMEAASEAGLDGTAQQTEFVEKYLKSGIRFADAEQDTSPDDDLNLKSKDLKGDWQTYELSRGEIADLKRLQGEYTAQGNQLKRGKTYENAAGGEIPILARRGSNRSTGSDAAYEQRKMRDLWEKAQIPESSIFGTPSKLKDLKHVSLDAPADGGQVDAARALRLYVRERYGDRLLADSRDALMTIAEKRGIKVENLAAGNGKIEFDISVENLLKMHHAYIGVQAKVNAELDAAQKTIDGLAHNRFAKGFVEGAWAQLKDNWEMVSSPIETVKGLYESAKAIGDIGLKLAQMKPEDRAKLFTDLAKAGVKGLAEMPVGDAAEHLGRFLGRVAVEAALGKGVAVAFKVLRASKIGAEMLQEAVKLGKEIKQTVGKIPIVPPGYKIAVTDGINRFPVIMPNGEWTKLEDLIKPLESRAQQMLSGVKKAVNLPAWEKLTVDLEHITSGHKAGGQRLVSSMKAGGAKDVFPEWMTDKQIIGAIKEAYGNAKKLKTQVDGNGDTIVKLLGQSNGIKIEMYVNTTQKMVQTAYPVVR